MLATMLGMTISRHLLQLAPPCEASIERITELLRPGLRVPATG